jgi:membrane fusion protein YbhG
MGRGEAVSLASRAGDPLGKVGMFNRAFALILLAAVAGGLLVWSRYRSEPLKVSGFIEAYEIRIGSRVGGRVEQVLVDEGAKVKTGETLVTLEPFDLQQQRAKAAAELAAKTADYQRLTAGYRTEEVEQAKAQYDRLAANLAELQNGPRKQEIAAAQARVRLADAELQLAQEQLARTERLVARNAATQEEYEQDATSLRVARSTLEVRQEELAQLQEGTRPEQIDAAKAQLEESRQAWLMQQHGYRAEEVAEADAAVKAAQAALDVIDQQLSELTITAPVDAVVEAIDLQPGDLVSPNAPVLSLMETSRMWVRAYVPENHLNLQVDQKLTVTVDSFPGELFHGHVSFIARQAEFTPSNVQTPEERSKQVFRIRVTLDDGLDRLRPGMSADVWLNGQGGD